VCPPSIADTHGEVTLTGRLSRQTVKLKDTVEFWISIDNRSGEELKQIQISRVSVPGFLLETNTKAADANCAGGTVLQASVPPYSSATVTGILTADRPEGLENGYLAVCWQQGDRPSRKMVQLGKAEALRPWMYHVSWFRGKPEVTIPAALTLLALLAAWWTRSRNERAQTWNTIQLESQKSSMLYLLPSASAAQATVSYLAAAKKAAVSVKSAEENIPLKKSFYYMMLFQWMHQRTFREVGGYHFQSRLGEDLLQMLFGRHKELFALYEGEAEFTMQRVLAQMKKKTTLEMFVELITIDADVASAWKIFKEWMPTEKCTLDVNVLNAYCAVLVYEVNRPNLNWYGTSEPLEAKDGVRTAILLAVGNENPRLLNRTRLYLFFNNFAKADNLWYRFTYVAEKIAAIVLPGKSPTAARQESAGSEIRNQGKGAGNTEEEKTNR
jgi:hypothetical protein